MMEYYLIRSLRDQDFQNIVILTSKKKKLLRQAFESMGLSVRARDRILRVSRTIADLEGSEQIKEAHLAEAISYRSIDRKYWGDM